MVAGLVRPSTLRQVTIPLGGKAASWNPSLRGVDDSSAGRVMLARHPHAHDPRSLEPFPCFPSWPHRVSISTSTACCLAQRSPYMPCVSPIPVTDIPRYPLGSLQVTVERRGVPGLVGPAPGRVRAARAVGARRGHPAPRLCMPPAPCYFAREGRVSMPATFVGFGFGPIQTGLMLREAARLGRLHPFRDCRGRPVAGGCREGCRTELSVKKVFVPPSSKERGEPQISLFLNSLFSTMTCSRPGAASLPFSLSPVIRSVGAVETGALARRVDEPVVDQGDRRHGGAAKADVDIDDTAGSAPVGVDIDRDGAVRVRVDLVHAGPVGNRVEVEDLRVMTRAATSNTPVLAAVDA